MATDAATIKIISHTYQHLFQNYYYEGTIKSDVRLQLPRCCLRTLNSQKLPME